MEELASSSAEGFFGRDVIENGRDDVTQLILDGIVPKNAVSIVAGKIVSRVYGQEDCDPSLSDNIQ